MPGYLPLVTCTLDTTRFCLYPSLRLYFGRTPGLRHLYLALLPFPQLPHPLPCGPFLPIFIAFTHRLLRPCNTSLACLCSCLPCLYYFAMYAALLFTLPAPLPYSYGSDSNLYTCQLVATLPLAPTHLFILWFCRFFSLAVCPRYATLRLDLTPLPLPRVYLCLCLPVLPLPTPHLARALPL